MNERSCTVDCRFILHRDTYNDFCNRGIIKGKIEKKRGLIPNGFELPDAYETMRTFLQGQKCSCLKLRTMFSVHSLQALHCGLHETSFSRWRSRWQWKSRPFSVQIRDREQSTEKTDTVRAGCACNRIALPFILQYLFFPELKGVAVQRANHTRAVFLSGNIFFIIFPMRK